jgi:arylsulfatase A-like enzyme
VTVASLLRESGYHTVMAGTWGLGAEPASLPSARGFESAFVLHDGSASYFSDMRSGIPGRDKALYTHDGKPVTELPEDYYSTEYFTDFVIESIEERHADGRPFFAYLAYQAPHGPFGLPDEWLDRAKGRYDDGYDAIRGARLTQMKMRDLVREEVQPYPGIPTIPSWGDLDEDQQKRQARKMELYAALVENLDHHVGRIVKYLEEKDELRNTTIIFMSDNGAEPANRGPNGMEHRDREWYEKQFPERGKAEWGRPGSFVEYGPGWAQVSTVPFRLFKGTQAEGGIRAPVIASGVGVQKRDAVNDGIAHVMDVPATILELAGVDHPATFAGRSVVPMEGTSWFTLHRTIFDREDPHPWLGMEFAGDRALRKGRWKLVWMAPPFGTGAWRLYRIDRDPSEIEDLVGKKPEKKAELEALWQEYARAHGVVIPKDELPEDAEGDEQEEEAEPVASR